MIARMELNLATRPFRNDAPLWALYVVAAIAIGALTTWNVRNALAERDLMAQIREDVRGVEGTLASLDRREAEARRAIDAIDIDALEARVVKANNFLARRGMSWTELFNRLELVQPYEVKMTSIRPMFEIDEGLAGDTAGRSVAVVPIAVDGLAQSLEAFLEFERALLLDPHFSRVEPMRSNIVDTGEVQFDLRFLYDPEGTLDQDEDTYIPPVLPAVAEAEADARADGAKRETKR